MRAWAPAARWLAGKTTGERRAVAVLLVVTAAALLWLALWQPLVRDTAAMRAVQADGAAALAAARTMADEAAGLARAGAPPASGDLRADLERALGQQGLRHALTQFDVQDGRARLVYTAIRYDALIAALETLQRAERIRIVEAALTARVEPGMVRAELTLAR